MESVKLFVKDDGAYYQSQDHEQNPVLQSILEEQPTEYEEVNELITLEQSCKQEVNFFGDYCRICACAYENMIPIFNETGIELQLEEKINSYLPITVTRNDKLPLQICEMCMEKLNITHDLILACVNSDTKFKYFEAQNAEEEDASKAKRKVVVMKLVSSNGAQLSVSARVAKALQYLKAKKTGDPREQPTHSVAGVPLVKATTRPTLQAHTSSHGVCPSDLDKVKVAAVAEFCVVASGCREKALAPKATGSSEALKSKICEALGPVDRGTNKRLVEAMHEIVCSSHSQQHLPGDCVATNGQRCNCSRNAMYETFQETMHMRPQKPSLADALKRPPPLGGPCSKRFGCKMCNKKFRDSYRLILHKQTRHVPRRPSSSSLFFYACAACGKQFVRKTSLLIHQALERGARRYRCTLCTRRFMHRCSLETHTAVEHPGALPWLCARCGRGFPFKNGLHTHDCAGAPMPTGLAHPHARAHVLPAAAADPSAAASQGVADAQVQASRMLGGEKSSLSSLAPVRVCAFLCSQCPKKLSSRQALEQHEATHAGARPYQCGICYVGFIRKTSLTKHYKTHASEKVICCKVCKASFPTVTGLINHSKTHSSDDWRPIIKRESGTDEGAGAGVAAPGAAGCSSGGGGAGAGSGPDAYQCSVCSKFLSNKLSLSLHMRTHTGDKPYECGVCQKRFTQKPALTYHQRLHTGERPHVCQFCGKGFNSKVGKESHERIHTGERPYKCGQCGVGFRCSANLRQHTWIHSDRRPFMCEVCKKLFRRREALQVHMRIHTGERPYSCPVCGRRFTQKGDMVKHTRSHSKDTQGVTCHKCGKIFSRRVHYKMHEEQCRHANIQLVQKPDKMDEKSSLGLLQQQTHGKGECDEPKTIAIVNDDMLPKFTDITIVPRDDVQEIEVEYETN